MAGGPWYAVRTTKEGTRFYVVERAAGLPASGFYARRENAERQTAVLNWAAHEEERMAQERQD